MLVCVIRKSPTDLDVDVREREVPDASRRIAAPDGNMLVVVPHNEAKFQVHRLGLH